MSSNFSSPQGWSSSRMKLLKTTPPPHFAGLQGAQGREFCVSTPGKERIRLGDEGPRIRSIGRSDPHLRRQRRHALRLLLRAYTFTRTGELRAAEWSEIETHAATWNSPASA